MSTTQYTNWASSGDPAYVIYMIDASESMSWSMSSDTPARPGEARIDELFVALGLARDILMRRSLRGRRLSSKYKVAILHYNDKVVDWYGASNRLDESFVPIERFQRKELRLNPEGRTNPSLAWQYVLNLLKAHLPHFTEASPAPVICHLTDGDINQGGDPINIVNEIKSLPFADGPPLIENIYIGQNLTQSPLPPANEWEGLTSRDELVKEGLKLLYDQASDLPASFAMEMAKAKYAMKEGRRMIIPASNKELLQMAYAMSTMTMTEQFSQSPASSQNQEPHLGPNQMNTPTVGYPRG